MPPPPPPSPPHSSSPTGKLFSRSCQPSGDHQDTLTCAESAGDKTAEIAKAQQKLAIMNCNIQAIIVQDERLDELDMPRANKQDQKTYGEDDKAQRRQETLETLQGCRDK